MYVYLCVPVFIDSVGGKDGLVYAGVYADSSSTLSIVPHGTVHLDSETRMLTNLKLIDSSREMQESFTSAPSALGLWMYAIASTFLYMGAKG